MKKSIIHKIKFLIAYVFVFLPLTAIYSQLSDWKNYTEHQMVTDLLVDGDYLWIATDGGLIKMNRLTGDKTFLNRANAGLPENHIRTIAKDKDGTVWMGTQNNGVGKYEGNNCNVYNEENSGLVSSQYCKSICLDNEGNIYIGSLFALNIFDGENWTNFTTPQSPLDMIWVLNDLKFDKEGLLWMGAETTSSRLFLGTFDGEKINVVPEILSTVNCIEIDEDNNKWLGTSKSGLIRFKNGEDMDIFNTDNSNLPSNNVHSMIIAQNGDIWFSCGIYLIKYDGNDFYRYDPELSNPSLNFILSIAQDDTGILWLGTKNEGLIKFHDEKFERIELKPSELSSNSVHSLLNDIDENIWIGTRNDLIQIDKNDNWNKTYQFNNYDTKPRIKAIQYDFSGNQWVALGLSDTCLIKNTPENKQVIKFSDMPFNEWSDPVFCFDRKGILWMGTYNGIYKYDGQSWTNYNMSNTSIKSNIINDLTIDKDDNLWGGCGERDNSMNKGCLFKFDGSEWTIFTPFNSPMPTHIPTNLTFDRDNNLWLNCWDKGYVIGENNGGGLTKYDGERWISYNTENSGIASNSLLSISIDKDGILWLGTVGKKGVTRFDGNSWEVYGITNSGIGFSTVQDIAFDYKRNMIWFSHTQNGGLSSANINYNTNLIQSTEASNSFEIYPNPASSQITIKLPDNEKICSLIVYTISGDKLFERKFDKQLSEMQLNIGNLNIQLNGNYIIEANTENKRYTEKLSVY